MSMNENELNELYPALRTKESRAKFASDMNVIYGHILWAGRLSEQLSYQILRASKCFDEYARVLHSELSGEDDLAELYKEVENFLDPLSAAARDCEYIRDSLYSLSHDMRHVLGRLPIQAGKLTEVRDLIGEWEALRFTDRVQNLLETLSDYGQVMKSFNQYMRSKDDENPLVPERAADACKSVNMTMPDPVLYASVGGFLEDALASAKNLNHTYFS